MLESSQALSLPRRQRHILDKLGTPSMVAQVCAIGPLRICVHSAGIALSMAAGLALLWLLARRRGLDPGAAMDAAFVGLMLGLVAGRAEVILMSLDYFGERPSSILDPRQGGFGFRSAAVVGIVSYLALVPRNRHHWLAYGDALVPALGVSAAIAWCTALLTGQAAGAPAEGPWALPLPDEYGLVVSRYPLQPMLALANLALAAFAAHRRSATLPPGTKLALWGTVTSALGAALGSFLAEPALVLGVLPRPVVADLCLALAWALLGLLFLRLAGVRGAAGGR